MAEQQNGNDDNRQWFLRINGETVFGPVSTQGLIVWAEQGRILPGHEVSPDRKKWMQAVSLDLLDMRWFVDDSTGELRGPLNRLAAEALIKSGKVAEGAQLVSADDVEEAEGAAEGGADTPSSKVSETQQQRIRELEKQAAELEPLRQQVKKLERKLKEAGSGGTRVAELELQLKGADSGGEQVAKLEQAIQFHERKAAETAQILSTREAELKAARAEVNAYGQRIEESETRARVAETALELQRKNADNGSERMTQLEQAVQIHARKAEEITQLLSTREAELKASGQKLEESEARARAAETALELQRKNADSGSERVAELEQAVQIHARKAEEMAQLLSTREADLKASGQKLEESEARARVAETARQETEMRLLDTEAARQEAEARTKAAEAARRAAETRADAAEEARQAAEAQARETEADMTVLLTDANARDISYQEKIAELEKQCSQSPEETARFFTDQAAVYELIKAESAELAAVLEGERTQFEQLKAWSVQRQQSLQERRQKLLKQLGGSPGEMTRRASREQPSDAQLARVRAELENLRVTHQREMQLAETKEREWNERLRRFESEESKLRAQVGIGEKKAQRAQELQDLIGRREHELASERKNREDEREQFEANQRTLLMRIETLERSAKPVTPEEVQSVEARNVKLASWMRLKR